MLSLRHEKKIAFYSLISSIFLAVIWSVRVANADQVVDENDHGEIGSRPSLSAYHNDDEAELVKAPETFLESSRMFAEARSLIVFGEADQAELYYDAIEEFLAESIDAREEIALGTLFSMAKTFEEHGYTEHAVKRYKELLAIMRRPLSVSAERQAQVLNAIATAYFESDELEESRRYFEEASSTLFEEQARISETSRIAISNSLEFYKFQGESEAVREHLRDFTSLEVYGGLSGLEFLLEKREDLADLLKDEGKDRQAIDIRRLALQEARVALGYMDLRSLDMMAPLARDLGETGRLEEALQIFEELETRPEYQDDPRRRFALVSKGSILAAQGRLKEAAGSFRDALDLMSENPTDFVTFEGTIDSLVNVLLLDLEYDQALEWALQRLATSSDYAGSSVERARAIEALIEVANRAGEREISETMARFWVDEIQTIYPSELVADQYREIALRYARQQQWGAAASFMSRYFASTISRNGANSTAAGRAGIEYSKILIGAQQFTEAEILIGDSRELLLGKRGSDHPVFSGSLDELQVLARLTFLLGETEEGLGIAESVLDIWEEATGESVSATIDGLRWRAELSERKGDLESAIHDYEQAIGLAKSRRDLGSLPGLLGSLGILYAEVGRYQESIAVQREGVDLRISLNGPKSIHTLAAQANLAMSINASGDRVAALRLARETTSELAAQLVYFDTGESAAEISSSSVLRAMFTQHLSVLKSEGEYLPSDFDDAFAAIQLARRSTASRALHRSTVRQNLRDPVVGDLMRDQRRFSSRRDGVELALRRLFDAGLGEASQASDLLQELAELNESIDRTGQRLREAKPDIGNILTPEPVRLEELRGLLRNGEVLVTYLVGFHETLVAVARPESLSVHVATVTEEELVEMVSTLRTGLIGEEAGLMRGALGKASRGLDLENGSSEQSFDDTLAHDLFELLLGDVVGLSSDERLIIVPDGPLSSIPFSVLRKSLNDDGFLGHHHPIVVMPAVSFLRERNNAATSAAPNAFFGLGNPTLNHSQSTTVPETGLSEWAQSLTPLPETALEILSLAQTFGAGEEDVLLGSAANEDSLRALDLASYRTLVFATHGLMAGELGLSQPALVLSPGKTGSRESDGLLTAEEINDLQLNADWVLLSACNTAAGINSQDEWLSGLATSFLRAGARSVIVSHWPVPSDATVDLTTLVANKNAEGDDLAEAYRQAMKDISNRPGYSDPRFWAGFSIVGLGHG